VLAGDECVMTKSGKQTHGLDRFFSSLFGKPVPGIALFALSLIDAEARRSYPVMAEQVVRSEEEKAAAKEKAQQRQTQKKKGQAKRKPGRPKGPAIFLSGFVALNRSNSWTAGIMRRVLGRNSTFGTNSLWRRVVRLIIILRKNLLAILRSGLILYSIAPHLAGPSETQMLHRTSLLCSILSETQSSSGHFLYHILEKMLLER
jgi:hypothetical protein